MALGLGSSSFGNLTAGSTMTVSIATAANEVNVLVLTYWGTSAATDYGQTTSISDPAGLTWRLRKRTKFNSPYVGAGTSAGIQFLTQEVWWSFDTVLHASRAMTVNVANSANVSSASYQFSGFTGSLTPTAPWDTNPSLPNVATFGNNSSTGAITVSGTTSQANSMVLGFVSEITSTLSGATLASTGTGYTAIGNTQSGTTPNFLHTFFEEKIQAAAGAVTATMTTSKQTWVAYIDALSGTSTGTAAGVLQITALVGSNLGSGAAPTLTYTAPDAGVLVLAVETWGVGGYCPITSITDTSGLTWKRRKQTQFLSSYTGFSSVQYFNQEIWWANSPNTQTSKTITINIANTASFQGTGTQALLSTVSGSLTPAAPWDTHPSNPQTTTYGNNSGVGATISTPYSASSTDALILAFMSQISSVGDAGTQGANFTLSNRNSIGTTPKATLGLEFRKGSTSGSADWVTNQVSWLQVTDAMSGTATGTAAPAGSASGTIITTLTKPSQTLAGNASTPNNGTITTSLTKLSQSVSGINTLHATGTIATALTKPGQAASGALRITGTVQTVLHPTAQTVTTKEIFTGTAATALSRISQALAGSDTNNATGTIATALSRINQTVTAKETLSGTIATALSGISQLAKQLVVTGTVQTVLRPTSQTVTAKEIFTGTIVSNLNVTGQITQGVVATEIFTGQIVTRLGPVNIAAVGEEDFIGRIAMKLGALSGQLVANQIQASVIIEGPIIMNLRGFKTPILAAKLGAAGGGKWYSYRYLDS